MESLLNCPACGGKNISKFIDCKDFTVSKETFSIMLCGDCKLKFTSPRPAEANIAPYYQSEEYISHSGKATGFINRIYLIIRSYTLIKKVQMILRLVGKNKSVLDYGAGTGDFLNALKGAGFTVAGVEPSATARENAKTNFGIVLTDNIQQSISNNQVFDLVTMWHVLEHVHRLDETLLQLKNLLTPSGVMLVAVPNADSYDASVYKEYWAAYDVPRHLYHFNQSSMTMLLEKYGMRVEKIMPMVFDSFYVSMLSEKYKGGNILKAFFTGLWSNIKGAGDKKYYSSLIYVVRPAK
jgi:2-polyprenyl-3-methyl-5-hydroxy-6-metoxy-1,4-benzoquinol methylase